MKSQVTFTRKKKPQLTISPKKNNGSPFEPSKPDSRGYPYRAKALALKVRILG